MFLIINSRRIEFKDKNFKVTYLTLEKTRIKYPLKKIKDKNCVYECLTYSRIFFPQHSYILTCTLGLRSHSLIGFVTVLPHSGHFI